MVSYDYTSEDTRQKLRHIDDVCDTIHRFWRKHPNWRIGQIIVDAIDYVNPDVIVDPFYVADESICVGIEAIDIELDRLRFDEQGDGVLPYDIGESPSQRSTIRAVDCLS